MVKDYIHICSIKLLFSFFSNFLSSFRTLEHRKELQEIQVNDTYLRKRASSLFSLPPCVCLFSLPPWSQGHFTVSHLLLTHLDKSCLCAPLVVKNITVPEFIFQNDIYLPGRLEQAAYCSLCIQWADSHRQLKFLSRYASDAVHVAAQIMSYTRSSVLLWQTSQSLSRSKGKSSRKWFRRKRRDSQL